MRARWHFAHQCSLLLLPPFGNTTGYQNREFGDMIGPFTEVREPNGSIVHSGRYPIPTFFCSDYRE